MEIVSGIGDGVFWVGLAGILLSRHEGALGFAMVAFARYAPRALVSAPAGVVADRVNRRRLLMTLDLGRAVSMAALAFAAAHGAGFVVLVAFMLITYTLAAPYRPAIVAALPVVVGEDSLSSANAVISTVRQLMTFVGPLLGVAVLHWTSSSVAFWLDAMTFVLSAILIGSIRSLRTTKVEDAARSSTHHADWRRDMTGGLRDVASIAGLSSVSIVVFVMYLARGAEGTLYVLVAYDRLDLGSGGVGVLSGAIGLGAMLVLPWVRRVAKLQRPGVALLVAMATTAAPIAALSVIHSAVVACAALVVLGAGLVVFEVVSVVMLQRLAPSQAAGRVFGLVGTASNAGKLVGAVAAPALVAGFGLSACFVVIGVFVVAVGAAGAPGLYRGAAAVRARGERLRPLVEVLADVALFDGASVATLERIADAVVSETIEAGDVVLRQGDPADNLFLIREGDFTVWDLDRQINTMHAGDWFGEIGLLQRRLRTATVVAASDAHVWRISGEQFLAAMAAAAAEPVAALDVLADRLARSERAAASAMH